METQIRAVEAATPKIMKVEVKTTTPTLEIMPSLKPPMISTAPSVMESLQPKPTAVMRTPLMMPSRKTKASFTPPQYGDRHHSYGQGNGAPAKNIVRFKRGQVDDLAYLQEDMKFLTNLARGVNQPQSIRLERSAHFRERQVERSVRTSEIFDIINNPKVFSYQKERVWKVEGQNGISILIAFSGLTTTGKQILLGITVYSEDSPETLSYKQWSQNVSNARKLAKNSKKRSEVSS